MITKYFGYILTLEILQNYGYLRILLLKDIICGFEFQYIYTMTTGEQPEGLLNVLFQSTIP